MDIIEKIDANIETFNDELAKLKPTDPNAKYICDNIKTMGDTRTNILKEDNARLNNNEVNDINRMKAEVEHEKVKVEKLKIGANLGSDVIDAVKCGAFCWISYNGDKVNYAIRSIFDTAKGYLRQRRH